MSKRTRKTLLPRKPSLEAVSVGKLDRVAEPFPKTRPPKKDPPFVKPGKRLHFVDKLKEQGYWPLLDKKRRPPRDRERGPTITPFVLIPAVAGDNGARPIADQEALYNASVQILNATGNPVLTPTKGSTYSLRCIVSNRGGAGAFGGMAEFYVAPAATLDAVAGSASALLPLKGLTGFSAMPGATVAVTCPKPWVPVTDDEAASSILVQAYDAFVDKVVLRFDARQDRHVGRRDFIPDFSGIWDGMESANPLHGVPTRIRIVITQNYLTVNAGFYMELGGGIPSTPQDTASGTILNGQVTLSSTEYIGSPAVPFTSNQWKLRIGPGGLLHFDHHRHYLMPGDTRPDTDTYGDLHRL
jgi:hypothetical protein